MSGPGDVGRAAAASARGSNRLPRMKSRLAAARPRRQRRPAGAEAGSAAVTGCAEVVVDQVEQLRRRLLGLHVDRDPVVRAAVVDASGSADCRSALAAASTARPQALRTPSVASVIYLLVTDP